MSALFSPMKIGNIKIPNRFVNSATYECMAKESGEVSDDLIKRYERLAKGGVGLIITGLMHLAQVCYFCQPVIHLDIFICMDIAIVRRNVIAIPDTLKIRRHPTCTAGRNEEVSHKGK